MFAINLLTFIYNLNFTKLLIFASFQLLERLNFIIFNNNKKVT